METTMIFTKNEHFVTHPDGKIFKFDLSSERSRADAFTRAKEHVAARRRVLEGKAGRPLTDDEFLKGRLDHPEDRSLLDVERDSKFTPVKKQPGRYDSLKADLLRKIEERDTMNLPPLERQLRDIERLENQKAESEAEQAAKDAHLANPFVAQKLKMLSELLEDMKFDPSRTKSELAAVENAISQLSDYQGDTTVAESMVRDVFDREDSRILAMDNEKIEQLKALEASLSKPRTGATPKVEVDRTQSLAGQGHSIYMQLADSGLPFAELDKIYEANRALEGGDSGPLEAVIEQYAVGENQTIA